MSFSLQVDQAIGKITKELGSVQGNAMYNFYTELHSKTPLVTGEVRKSIQTTINGSVVDPPRLKNAKLGDELSVRSSHEAMLQLDQGTYSNPGMPHYSKYNTGIFIRKAGKGFIVIRTTPQGFSTKATKGMLRFARTAFARSFRGT